MKIVINACFGGFSLSHKGVMRYLELCKKQVWLEPGTSQISGLPTYWLVPPDKRQKEMTSKEWAAASLAERQEHNKISAEQTLYDQDIPRDDPNLVQVVEELGSDADGRCAELRIVEIPDGTNWEIDEYDGYEHVAEVHRTWR